jgi:hypothetical protein
MHLETFQELQKKSLPYKQLLIVVPNYSTDSTYTKYEIKFI